jgi:hypothetical protein
MTGLIAASRTKATVHHRPLFKSNDPHLQK